MFLKIDSVTIFDKKLLNDRQIFNTNINLSKIEDFINNILDKHNDLCKYYFNINENYWAVSFKVGIDQIDVMCKSTFEINLYKNVIFFYVQIVETILIFNKKNLIQ